MDRPLLSKQLLGNVDIDSIYYEKLALYVTEQVIDRGSMEDFVALRRFYGDDRIRKEIVHTKEFGPKEVSFCCLVFDLKPKDFIYPISKPAYPKPWDYSGA